MHRRERGATAVEYCLLVTAIALAIVGITVILGVEVGEMYQLAVDRLDEATGVVAGAGPSLR